MTVFASGLVVLTVPEIRELLPAPTRDEMAPE
jgi:hypothetical protein